MSSYWNTSSNICKVLFYLMHNFSKSYQVTFIKLAFIFLLNSCLHLKWITSSETNFAFVLDLKWSFKMNIKSIVKSANSKETQKIQNISFYVIQILCGIADITIGILVSKLSTCFIFHGWTIAQFKYIVDVSLYTCSITKPSQTYTATMRSQDFFWFQAE